MRTMKRTLARQTFRGWLSSRRGVAAVLAMMFLVLFGSLATAMAIASRGNIVAAATHMHVSRAQSAAETGLAIGRARLEESAARFVVSSSNVTTTFGEALWTGSGSALGSVTVLPSASGRLDLGTPAGLASAVAELHAQDQNIVTSLGVTQVTVGNALAGVGSEYAGSNWVFTPAVELERAPGQQISTLAYTVTYAPLANGTDVRVIATGFDLGYDRAGVPIQRTVMQDFRMRKGVRHAIVASSRVMIGKNVMVHGDIGARFGGVGFNNGDPLVTRSDFAGLVPSLTSKLNAFYAAVASADVDGDNRLRVGHPTENAALPSNETDYDSDGQADSAFTDATGDGYVDEFDIFINHFDRNDDKKVTLSAALTEGTPAEGLSNELVDAGGNPIDSDLGLLIDSNNPDRNRNGVWGFSDSNLNARWDDGELMADLDTNTGRFRDQVLGYRDGFVDKKDQYAKIAGGLKFSVSKSAWTTQRGAVTDKLKGPVVAPKGTTATSFSVPSSQLPAVDVNTFSTSRSALQSAADGQSFDQQVATNLGIGLSQVATYSAARPTNQSAPWYRRLDANSESTSLPANAATAYFEKMPFNSPSYSDVYFRPVYYNMTFKDVQIPKGNNGLYVNCTFVGVTYVRSESANTHILWTEYGKCSLTGSPQRPALVNPRFIYTGTNYPTMLPSTARPTNQNILMAVTPMDKADLDSTQTARPGYSMLPDPLVVAGKRITDTKTLSNNMRFHDCLFVGSIVSDVPSGYTQTRNKVQFTGATRFVDKHPSEPNSVALNPEAGDRAEIAKSSMMLPNYSVDLGQFNSPANQNIDLSGAVIAGVLDARGNVSIDGSLMLTFAPTLGEGPLRDSQGAPMGNPANFNTTIGYFGPTDGDSESLDPSTLPVVGGQRIVGWDTDGDGIADVGPDQSQPGGSTAVPFTGYGRIQLRFNPNMTLPDGIMLPMQMIPLAGTYREGHP